MLNKIPKRIQVELHNKKANPFHKKGMKEYLKLIKKITNKWIYLNRRYFSNYNFNTILK